MQNLFFATLSTKKDDRKFRSEIRGYKGYNPDFGNQNVFRFQELFKNPENLINDFGEIPFLNGGLFECLDDKPKGIYIDGFTDVEKNQPNVPNFLFFSQEKKADLNAAYGTKSKTYKVRGLLDILSSFDFTIDENSPDDQDIALDPELLGRVFENLLASFNPETSTTARKATGSYYTPREIVDYMVAESLKAYFKTHLSATEDLDKKIDQLFSTESEENPFDKSEPKKIVELIESVRIVDPAVGSGAFPMGALNKLVFILNKVDPGNELWKQAQISAADAIPDPCIKQDTKNRIEEFFKGKNADYGRKLYLIQKCIYGVDIQQIAVEIAKLRFFISLLVDEEIDKTKENWGIEPLPNLDFKIMQGNSLISEFLGIDFDNGQEKKDAPCQVELRLGNKDDSLIKEFERKKIDYQNESDKDKKAKLKNEVEDLMIKIFESKVEKQKAGYFKDIKEIERKYSVLPNKQLREEIIAKEKQKLSRKTGFDLENIEKQLREFTSKKKTRPFFPWKLYFAEVFSEKCGFDIVIANPPFISYYARRSAKLDTNTLRYYQSHYDFITDTKLDGKFNSVMFFLEKAVKLSNINATTFFILDIAFNDVPYRYIRKYLLNNAIIDKLITGLSEFENVYSDQILLQFSTGVLSNKTNHLVSLLENLNSDSKRHLIEQSNWLENKFFEFNLPLNDMSTNFIKRIEMFPKLGELFPSKLIRTCMSLAGHEDEFLLSNNNVYGKKIVLDYIQNAKNLPDRYSDIINSKKVVYDEELKDRLNQFYRKDAYNEIRRQPKALGLGSLYSYKRPKIFVRQSADKIIATYTEKVCAANTSFYVINSEDENGYKSKMDLKCLLGILNSKLLTFYAISRNIIITGNKKQPQMMIKPFKTLPIPKISGIFNNKIINCVDKILTITKSSDYLENPAKNEQAKEYERQIDQMVYELYGLTEDEIKIIEQSGAKDKQY